MARAEWTFGQRIGAGFALAALVLAVVAAFARGETVITGVPHLRHKESDRLAIISNSSPSI